MPTCPQCGSNNADTSTSCWKCYAPLTAGASAGAGAPSAPTAASTPRAAVAPRPVSAPRSRSKGSPLPLILVIVLLLAVGGGGGYYWFVLKPMQDAKATATEFMKAQGAFDFAKMKQLATSNSAQVIDFGEKVIAQIPQIKSLVKVDKIETGTATISGGEAQVTVNVTASAMGTTQTQSVTLALVREGGAWKVDVQKSNQSSLQQLLKQGSGLKIPGLPGMGGR